MGLDHTERFMDFYFECNKKSLDFLHFKKIMLSAVVLSSAIVCTSLGHHLLCSQCKHGAPWSCAKRRALIIRPQSP